MPNALCRRSRSPALRAAGRDGLVAGAVAWGPSGIPSTLHALLTGRDVLDTVRAAGSLLAAEEASERRLLVSGVVAHTAISLGWGVVLSLVLPRRRGATWGAAAGLAIAALDLGVAARLVPRMAPIRSLPAFPQLADHLTYGAIVGAVLSRRAAGAPELEANWSRARDQASREPIAPLT